MLPLSIGKGLDKVVVALLGQVMVGDPPWSEDGTFGKVDEVIHQMLFGNEVVEFVYPKDSRRGSMGFLILLNISGSLCVTLTPFRFLGAFPTPLTLFFGGFGRNYFIFGSHLKELDRNGCKREKEK